LAVARPLGQHFLKPASVDRLVLAIDPRPGDTIIEIGPGAGALTLPLAARVKRIVGVELDGRLAARLRERVPANVEIVVGDARRVDLASLTPPGSRLVGNLPYYASSPLLRRFLELRRHFVDLHVMLQDEVARRIAAPPGGKDYGILSVLFGLWSETSIPLRFPPGAFDPPPRVDSAVLRVRFLDRPRADPGEAGALEALLKQAFARRRRTLENNLRDSYANLKENLRLLNIAGSRRPETLSVVEFATLSSALKPQVRPGR
jgi:16S rRNA (adenine1518-N6/adenine1519-N6)-dimethyltransferase